MNMQKSFLSLCWRSPKHHMHHNQHWMTIFEIVPSLHGPVFIAKGCDRPTGNVYSGVASGGSYVMGLAANPPFWAIRFFNIYSSPVHGSDHLRTRTWPFWTEPTVRSKVHHNQWTEPIVQFWVLQNPLKNRTEPNLTVPITLSLISQLTIIVFVTECSTSVLVAKKNCDCTWVSFYFVTVLVANEMLEHFLGSRGMVRIAVTIHISPPPTSLSHTLSTLFGPSPYNSHGFRNELGWRDDETHRCGHTSESTVSARIHSATTVVLRHWLY